MKRLIAITGLIFLVSCQSQPGAVNTDYRAGAMRPTLDTSLAPDAPPVTQEAVMQQPRSALSGTIYQKDRISSILMNTKIGLYQKSAAGWSKVDETNSDFKGEFSITKKLYPGEYELRVLDPKYTGKMPVILENKPLSKLIFEVNRN